MHLWLAIVLCSVLAAPGLHAITPTVRTTAPPTLHKHVKPKPHVVSNATFVVEVEDFRFELFEESLDFDAALSYCESSGGELAVIKDVTEQDALTRLLEELESSLSGKGLVYGADVVYGETSSPSVSDHVKKKEHHHTAPPTSVATEHVKKEHHHVRSKPPTSDVTRKHHVVTHRRKPHVTTVPFVWIGGESQAGCGVFRWDDNASSIFYDVEGRHNYMYTNFESESSLTVTSVRECVGAVYTSSSSSSSSTSSVSSKDHKKTESHTSKDHKKTASDTSMPVGAVSADIGKWIATDCFQAAPFVCQYEVRITTPHIRKHVKKHHIKKKETSPPSTGKGIVYGSG